MSLFNFIRGELIDIIEWNEPAESDLLAWRFPRADNEIKNGAKLVVREGQVAILVNMGKLADVFEPGMYTLETKNIPILSTLMGWKYGFDSPFKCEVYFVSTRRFQNMKWGTANPVVVRDREFGMVRVRAYGTFAIQVSNPVIFLRQIIGSDPALQTFEVSEQMKSMIVTRFSDAIASSNIPALDMAAQLDELSDFCRQKITKDIAEMGLGAPVFLVENISLPPNVEAALDKRTSMGMIGNVDQYMKFQAADALTKAAENPSGGAAGIGVGLGAGLAMANQMAAAMQPSAGSAPPPLPTGVVYYAGINGQQAGPFTPDALRAQAAAGAVTRDTLVWKQGMANWTKAGDVADLAAVFAAVPPPMPQ